MTKDALIQLKKNTALNQIRDIFNPKKRRDYYEDGDSRDIDILIIIENLDREIKEIKSKYKSVN